MNYLTLQCGKQKKEKINMNTPSIDYLYREFPILDCMIKDDMEYINLNIWTCFKEDIAKIDILTSPFLYKGVLFTTEKQKDESYNIYKHKLNLEGSIKTYLLKIFDPDGISVTTLPGCRKEQIIIRVNQELEEGKNEKIIIKQED
ncbi:unnamed protein product [marine sediment metagenome]|uniref:Uncharacterized protein n=1 Tax=marine sediment metagenome TaxID=412755 RepID=X1FN60_9ZZZZ